MVLPRKNVKGFTNVRRNLEKMDYLNWTSKEIRGDQRKVDLEKDIGNLGGIPRNQGWIEKDDKSRDP